MEIGVPPPAAALSRIPWYTAAPMELEGFFPRRSILYLIYVGYLAAVTGVDIIWFACFSNKIRTQRQQGRGKGDGYPR